MKRKAVVLAVMTLLILWALPAAISASSITASFSRTELKLALSIVSELGEVPIAFGQDISGTTTLELVDESVETALTKILMGTPYTFTHQNGVYIVGLLDPRSPYFPLVAETRVFDLKFIEPELAARHLETYRATFRYRSGSSLLTVAAVPEVMERIEEAVLTLDTKDNPRQVAYTLDIVEISEQKKQNLKMESFLLDESISVSSLIRFIANPSIFELIHPTVGVKLDGGIVEEERHSVANPQIVAALGKQGRMRIVEETLLVEESIRKESKGFDLTVSPLRINKELDIVLSRVQLKTGDQTVALDTEIWVPNEQSVLLGVLEKDLGNKQSSSKETDEAYFALYLSAKPVGPLVDGRHFPLGSLSGLKSLLFSEQSAPRMSYVEASYGMNDKGVPDLEASVWLTDGCLVESRVYQGSEERFQAGLHAPVRGRDIRVGMDVLNTPSGGTTVSVGLSDVVRLSDVVTLTAGINPIVYSLETNELVKPSWYFEAAAEGPKSNVKVGYRSEQESPLLYGSAGVKVMDNLSLIVSYRLHDHNHRFLVGVRSTFGK